MVQLKTKPQRQMIPPKKETERHSRSLKSFDTETTGLDSRHGALPFFITSTDSSTPLEPDYWEWRVDPLTRQPIIPPGDLEEIKFLVRRADRLVLQNAKFDITMMMALDPWFGDNWPFNKTDDLLYRAHLLGSNRPKSLDALTIEFLNIDISRYEQKLKEACDKARRYCRSRLKNWRISKKGEPDMPSAKEECWKFDTWLPRAVVEEVGLDDLNEHYGEDMSWWLTALREYSNADSIVTCALDPVMEERIRERRLGKIYSFRIKLLEVAFKMERRGVTISEERLDSLETDYTESSRAAELICKDIARTYGHDLEMPKGASVNASLRTLVYDHMKLEPVYNPKNKKTNAPTLDSKTAIPHYLETLDPKSKEYRFIQTLSGKRKRDTACTFMRMYSKFWQPVIDCHQPDMNNGEQLYVEKWYRLHPNFKPTATDTLRWGCDNPAVQNISKKENFNLRYCFGPAPGREWWSLDAKNIELRLPFYESGELALIDLFEHPDDPPFYGSNHLLNFSVVYPDVWADAVAKVGLEQAGPYCKKTYKDSYYQWVKNGNFAIQYGAVDKDGGNPNDPSTWGTADRAFHKFGAHKLLKSRFHNLEVLNRRCIEFANRHGYVETIPDRTVDPDRGYPLLCTRTEYGGILETVPLSYRIQGSAMWWTSKGQVRCQEKLDLWQSSSFDGFITMQVHDEIVFDLPKSQISPTIHAEREKKGETIPLFERGKSNWWRVKTLAALMAEGGNDFITPSTPNGIPTPVGIELHTENWSEGLTLV